MFRKITLLALALLIFGETWGQHSVARRWNEMLLTAISGDLARPTVHARNLFHTSVAMYDAWAVYSSTAETYLIGKELNGIKTELVGLPHVDDVKAAQEEAISYAAYRILKHRFAKSPRADITFLEMDNLMLTLGYDPNFTSTEYTCSPAGMGNFIAQAIIDYGLQDGSNEANNYQNFFYEPVNPPLKVDVPGTSGVVDMNRWQPLQMSQIIDQSGNPLPGNKQIAVTPEWGQVLPFALLPSDASLFSRDNFPYVVYHDPGPAAQHSMTGPGGIGAEYQWNHTLVATWSSHLDPADGVLWDISPASIGNIADYPTSLAELRNFYDLENGGDISPGHPVNPKTGQPYAPQIVHRGDYTRVLAEFWADGPSSTTPPGHWFEVWNYVNDQPGLVRKWRGQGPELDVLEWDVKTYFALGGAMHDAAVTAWGIKGWYDSSRPITALRGMAELGQSSDPNLPNYHPGGLPLIPGFIELIPAGDPLQGQQGEYIGDLKMRAWRGPNYVQSPATDVAGVDWIRADFWWPYQRPTFVSPPFAGLISGHSTYSRTAAEVLTAITADPYFPGGVGEFHCEKNLYLVFEDGPSEDITLQWATYRDASDQCSLSRIWGGIHPPMDDIPGRHIGMVLGPAAVFFAEQLFTKDTPTPGNVDELLVYPNPTNCSVQLEYPHDGKLPILVTTTDGRLVRSVEAVFTNSRTVIDLSDLPTGMYILAGVTGKEGKIGFSQQVFKY
jgi:hypothetical protein